MSSGEESLSRLADATAEAVTGVLELLAPGQIRRGEVDIVRSDVKPLDGFPAHGLVTSVSYVDGVTGGNTFAMTRGASRALAGAMIGGEEEPPEDDEKLSDVELSAIAEAMNQMMAAAASATGAILGHEVEISPPETVPLEEPGAADASYESTAHATTVAITVAGEPCRLVQLVPNAFLVRMTRALDDLSAEDAAAAASAQGAASELLAERLADVPVRVWAELGRTRMPTAQVVGLPPGTVVDLDRGVDEPIDLYVNGLPFATGRLVIEDGDWAVRIEEVAGGGDAPGFEPEAA